MNGWGKLLRGASGRIALLLLLALLFLPEHASAQTTTTYTNSSRARLNSGTSCNSPLVRTFSVGTSFAVGDVDLGVLATHSWRGDINITLQSPSGTRVQLVDGDSSAGANISGNNFNVLLDDDGTQVVNTDSPTASHSATAPPFQHNFAPNASLGAFAGQSSAGTWTLEICDLFSGSDNGWFEHAELRLTSAPASYADLSLAKAISNPSPAFGTSVTYTLTVTNSASSPNTTSGVTVTDLLPAGVSYTGHSGFGVYDPATGLWTVGSLSPGQSRTLSITATVTATAGATVTNQAEVASSSVTDLDSTPGNGLTGEDDHASASMTVSGTRVAGIPPPLICPKGSLAFDWDVRSWTSGSTNNSYTMTGLGIVAFSIANQGIWLNLLGGDNPVRTNQVTGGFTPAQYSLAQTVDMANQSQVATTTITLPMAVEGAQFRLFDVDYGANQFADYVSVTGTYNGSPVTPVLTNGVANYVIGNQAFGDAAAGNDSANGTVTVTFQSAVDTIIIEYGNHALAPGNPGQQAIALHDIALCEPYAPVSVTKISSVVSDPVKGATDPVTIPGAVLSYCVLLTNSGSARASGIAATDDIPATLSYTAGSMRSGANCASASTVEDDDNTGADESDPLGASVSGNQLLIAVGTLDGGQSVALKYDAVVN